MDDDEKEIEEERLKMDGDDEMSLPPEGIEDFGLEDPDDRYH